MISKKIFFIFIFLGYLANPLFARKHILDKKQVVVLYKNCGFSGQSVVSHLGSTKVSVLRFGLSSFELPEGWGLIIYQKRNFKGGHKFFTRSVSCLKNYKVNAKESTNSNPHASHKKQKQGTMDNRAASYRVIKIKDYRKYHP